MKKLFLTIMIFSFVLGFSQRNKTYIMLNYPSICCGPPSIEPLIIAVVQFQKEHKLQKFEIFQEKQLGREMAYNLYIGIDKLDEEKRAAFMEKIKTAIDKQNETRVKDWVGSVEIMEALVTREEIQQLLKKPRKRYNKIVPFNYNS
jgi:hypothetical protein